MSSPQNPGGCCNSPEVVNVPGVAGSPNHATTTSSFAIPAIGSQVVVPVADSSMMGVGLPVFATDGNIFGTFQVFAVPNSTSVVLTFLGSAIDSPVGSSILLGAKIIPSGIGQTLSLPMSLINGGTGVAAADYAALRSAIFEAAFDALTPITDNTTGSATSTLAAGVGIETWIFETRLIDLTAATLILFTPGYAFKVLGTAFTVELAATTAAKAATLTPNINGVAVTGGVLALTSANMTPVGANVAGTAVTATNTGTAAQTFSIVGSAITAFVEGSGYIIVKVQNMDTANAVASLAAKINALQTGVGP